MKIVAIRGKNLASLHGEFEIDFTAEPLKSAGIFAITGQTGAGKSTILDALCLALFDNAPRLNKAESVHKDYLENVSDKISPQDCRNILRRGCSDGYAEVDFIALNGDKYRSRWTVRRARGKSGGALQATSMALDNLTNNTPEQGTKKDLLNRITEIIGLTFDQFTRAVLLAQGDFANFLKAKQNEKAELLEKLTGTEVYSKISVLIFQRTAEAKNALELIRQRIVDVKLLSKEELDALNTEKQNLEKDAVPLKLQRTDTEKKLDWLHQQEQLRNETLQAEAQLKSISEKIIDATPRYGYMSLLDKAQEIKDDYLQLKEKTRQHNLINEAISKKEKELKSVSEKYLKTESELQAIQQTVTRTEEKFNAMKPEIAKAKELDFRIASLKEKLEETGKEVAVLRSKTGLSEKTISGLQKLEADIKQKQEELAGWFEKHARYTDIVPKADWINTLINNAYSIKQQATAIVANLQTGKSLLNTYTSRLEELEKEAARLDKLLPAEILDLRNRLEEDKPCPVCGSTHHPFREEKGQQERIDENKLETEKKKTADAIALLKDSIEKTKKSITELETHTGSLRSQYENTRSELKTLLEKIPDWEMDFRAGSLAAKLTGIVSQWNQLKQQSDTFRAQFENNSIRIDAECRNREEIKSQLKEKESRLLSDKKIWETILEERKLLLGNKNTGEVEAYYSEQIKLYSGVLEKLRNEKTSIEKEKASIAGILTQLIRDKNLNDELIRKLKLQVQTWLNDNSGRFTAEILEDIMNKPHEWITSEKNFLTELKNRELVAKTTYQERLNKLNRHHAATIKPGEKDTKDSLLFQLQELTEKSESIITRITGINAALLSHNDGKEKLKAFEKELNEKTELYANWDKLNHLLGSASGNKFKTIAQGYTLDVLLSYANKHLEELTRRYRLEKIPDTLALQVTDNDMLGEIRTVHSLSGGESFLISLALALGLSSLSSNRMKIESLFIDEGFGALDIDTLGIAMDALDKLQTQGRKIGVISHVEEMKERINTRIQVVKSANGRSDIFVSG